MSVIIPAEAIETKPLPFFGQGQLHVSEIVNIDFQTGGTTNRSSLELASQAAERSFESVPIPADNASAVGPGTNKSTATDPVTDLRVLESTPHAYSAHLSDELSLSEEGGLTDTRTMRSPTNETVAVFSVPQPIDVKSVNVPKNSTKLIDEPSVASKGKLIFFTGNTYAARSQDNGTTWRYIKPFSDMEQFCCDQIVTYIPHYQIFIWYRQGFGPYIQSNNSGDNSVRIGVSHDTITWAMYEFKATTLNPAWRVFFLDYPQIAFGNEFLYLTSNMFDENQSHLRTVRAPDSNAIMLRISLKDLSEVRAASYSYMFGPKIYTFTPVQGATTKMYWATHLNSSAIRIYQLNESLPVEKTQWYDRKIPLWNQLTEGHGGCGVQAQPTGVQENNWCGHADSRINTGWTSGKLVGFFWNADARTATEIRTQGYFPFPYINAATFDVTKNMTYLGRPYIWSPRFAWLYPSVSVNNNDVALLAYYGNDTVPPSIAFGISNNLTKNDHWNMVSLKKGTDFPSIREDRTPIYQWGDYVTLRARQGQESKWYAAAFVLENGQSDSDVKPYYFTINGSSLNDYLPCIRQNIIRGYCTSQK